MPQTKSETISEFGMPSMLSYPQILGINQVPEIINETAYVIKKYKLDGISVMLFRAEGGTNMQFGDWDGNVLDPTKAKNAWHIKYFMDNYAQEVIRLTNIIGLPQCQLYISVDNKDMCLVDARVSINKFVSPAMLEDLFKKIMPTQEFKEKGSVLIDKNVIAELMKEKVILKTTSFKTIIRGNTAHPLYAQF